MAEKRQGFISSPFFGKNTITCNIWAIFPGNRAESQVKGLEPKSNKSYFIQTIPDLQFWLQHFPVLWLEITKDISERFQQGFSSLDAFSWYHAHISEKGELDLLTQNLLLNLLEPISIPKMKK